MGDLFELCTSRNVEKSFGYETNTRKAGRTSAVRLAEYAGEVFSSTSEEVP